MEKKLCPFRMISGTDSEQLSSCIQDKMRMVGLSQYKKRCHSDFYEKEYQCSIVILAKKT